MRVIYSEGEICKGDYKGLGYFLFLSETGEVPLLLLLLLLFSSLFEANNYCCCYYYYF